MSETIQPELEIGEILSAGFSPLKTRFWGVLYWVGIPFMVSYLILGGGALWWVFVKLSPLFTALISAEGNTLEFSDFLPALWAYCGIMFVVFIPIALARAAVFRFHATGKFKGVFFGFRFGGDELRQYVMVFLLFITTIVLPIAVLVTAIVFAEKTLSDELTAGLAALAFFLLPLVFIVLGVRFSLALAQTFAEKRLRLFGSWHLTKGHFWVLFLSFAVMMTLFGMASLAVSAPANILFYIQSETGWIGDPEILTDLDPAEFPGLIRDTFLSAKSITAFVWAMVFGIIVNVLQITSFSGASLYAVQKIKGTSSNTLVKTT